MRRCAWRYRLGPAAAIATFVLLLAGRAAAHPMGNFSINHYAAITVAVDRVEMRYLIDMAEIPTFQEMREYGFKADPADPRVAAYLAQECRLLIDGLVVELKGRRLELRELSRDVIFPPGAGGLPTMKIGMRLRAAAVIGRADAPALNYRDLNFPARAGWKEVIATGSDGVALAASSVPERDRSAELSNYPVDLLSSPPQVLEARLQATLLAAGSGHHAESSNSRLSLRANRAGTPRNAFTELMKVREPGLGFLLTATLIALALGALHALEPGHGKTVVAAYLVGSRGTARHALMLAATVTASHTAGVYVLGALTLYASQWIIPERIYPWLGGVSGMIVAVLGAGLFAHRMWGLGRAGVSAGPLRTGSSAGQAPARHPLPQIIVTGGTAYPSLAHGHEHGHDGEGPHHEHHHGHDHEHGHDHSHPHRHDLFGRHIDTADSRDGADRLSTRGLLALGITGGIVPCPAALVVLLSALSFNRVALGLFLIVAFSVGLAAVLIGFGLAVVYARDFAAHRLRLEGNAAVAWLPLVSSAVITIAGVAITFQSLITGGVITAWR